MKTITAFLPVLAALPFLSAAPAQPRFEHQVIDDQVKIGYGLAIADVNGDAKPDLLLVDKDLVAWYENPSWKKHVMARNLTPRDHVCIAARDIDGDGKAEVAVGAEWNPGDTVNSGAVFYLLPPADRTQPWTPVRLHHEPVVHRMHWVQRSSGKFELVVLPLHGRANRNGEGAGVRILSYAMPPDPHDPWQTTMIDDSLHLTHNFDVVDLVPDRPGESFVAGAKEGLLLFVPNGNWRRITPEILTDAPFPGAGEVRFGRWAGGAPFIATIEPMHGNQVAVYSRASAEGDPLAIRRRVLDDTLADGHALACADFLRAGTDQVVAGWRSMRDPKAKVGVKMFIPGSSLDDPWRQHLIDDNGMACEDLRAADLDGDGKIDIAAAGRATHNLKIYWNRTP